MASPVVRFVEGSIAGNDCICEVGEFEKRQPITTAKYLFKSLK
jgi:hypothetical protein